MPTTIHINAKDLDLDAIKSIQEIFGNADLEIRSVDTGDTPTPLSEEECWALINLLDWSFEDQDDEKVVAPLVEKLQSLSVANIYQFADWLSEKLWNLDTKSHAQVFLQQDDYLSVDDFLYARCAVVANGKDFYEHVLLHPAEMPTEVTFEALLYLPQEAYEKKAGKDMVYIPPFNFETYSNHKGWEKEA